MFTPQDVYHIKIKDRERVTVPRNEAFVETGIEVKHTVLGGDNR